MSAVLTQPESHRDTWKKVALVMAALLCAGFFRIWLYQELESRGMPPLYARYLTLFPELPLLALLLWPLWKTNGKTLVAALKPATCSARLVLIGLGVGIAHRVAVDGIVVAKVAFGVTRNADPFAIVGPEFALGCPSPAFVLLHLVSLALFTPVVEELIFRGWITSWLSRYGKFWAVLVSATLFMSIHERASMEAAFVFGLYMGVLYLNTGSLWPVIIAHCVSNGLILVYWHCVTTQWNPTGSSGALVAVGTISTLMVIFAYAFAALIVSKRIAAPEHGDASG